MAPSATVTEFADVAEPSEHDVPRKRLKLRHMQQTEEREDHDDDETVIAVTPHPLMVKPSGNAITSQINVKKNAGYFARLPDELTMLLIESLEPHELLRVGHCCKFLYACTFLDELWRALFVRASPPDFDWQGTWRSTFLKLPKTYQPHFDCSNVYSDVLHRPFYCSVTPLARYAHGIPKSNSIRRLSDLSLDEFNARWSDQPFILTSPIKEWPAYKQWTKSLLLEKHSKTKLRAEAVDWPLETYFEYMDHSADESPLYLFDRDFAKKMGTSYVKGDPQADYWPPDCFSEDLFAVLGDQRPDCRWLIIGPDRSGSTFHKDPNGTSAWNAVLTGAKYWLMFPSSSTLPPPPGVILSEDHSEITSPLSIAEYLLTFHEMARETPGCREGVCYAGEVLHVPAGWFHLVLNLEESIAITQNFVPREKLADVLMFLRDLPDQISGFKDDVEDPYALFTERLEQQQPELLAQALSKVNEKAAGRSSKWEEVTRKQEPANGDGDDVGFGFGFNFDEGGEEDDI